MLRQSSAAQKILHRTACHRSSTPKCTFPRRDRPQDPCPSQTPSDNPVRNMRRSMFFSQRHQLTTVHCLLCPQLVSLVGKFFQRVKSHWASPSF
eukprot:s2309_g7.t1